VILDSIDSLRTCHRAKPQLRDEAKTQLGEKFDLKAFHDEILNGGSMPLDLLKQRVEAWIKDQASKTASSSR
jgi:uncharacterized protein (DUF885 family)